MKTKTKHIHIATDPADQVERVYPINYRWSAGGVICHGRTVVFGRNRNDASRRFFLQNRHVEPAEAA